MRLTVGGMLQFTVAVVRQTSCRELSMIDPFRISSLREPIQFGLDRPSMSSAFAEVSDNAGSKPNSHRCMQAAPFIGVHNRSFTKFDNMDAENSEASFVKLSHDCSHERAFSIGGHFDPSLVGQLVRQNPTSYTNCPVALVNNEGCPT